MSLPIAEDLPKAIHHLEVLKFAKFDEDDAWSLGEALRKGAEKIGQGVAIEISRGEEQLFFSLMSGATEVNVDWIRRKRNLVNITHKTSYETGLFIKFYEPPMEVQGLAYEDFAWHGGGFPVIIDGQGHIATIIVSGLPQRDDHKLVSDVIADYLGVDLGEFAL